MTSKITKTFPKIEKIICIDSPTHARKIEEAIARVRAVLGVEVDSSTALAIIAVAYLKED